MVFFKRNSAGRTEPMNEPWLTIADHLRDVAEETPGEQIPEVIGALERAKAVLYGRIVAPPTSNPNRSSGKAAEPDRLLNPDELAAILNTNKSWVYRNANTLPFTVRVSRKQLRFSEAGLRRWMATRR